MNSPKSRAERPLKRLRQFFSRSTMHCRQRPHLGPRGSAQKTEHGSSCDPRRHVEHRRSNRPVQRRSRGRDAVSRRRAADHGPRRRRDFGLRNLPALPIPADSAARPQADHGIRSPGHRLPQRKRPQLRDVVRARRGGRGRLYGHPASQSIPSRRHRTRKRTPSFAARNNPRPFTRWRCTAHRRPGRSSSFALLPRVQLIPTLVPLGFR